MLSMKISEGGRVEIPVEIRRALNLKDGDSVLWDLVDGQARLSTQRSQLEQARALFQQFCPPQANGQSDERKPSQRFGKDGGSGGAHARRENKPWGRMNKTTAINR